MHSFLQMGVRVGTRALVGLPQPRDGDWSLLPTKERMGDPAQQIPAPEHTGDTPGREQGEQKLEGGSPKSQKCRWGGRGGSSWSQRSLCSHECFGRDDKTCCCDFLAVSWQHPWPKQGRGAPCAGLGQRRWERRRLMTQSVYNLNNDM